MINIFSLLPAVLSMIIMREVVEHEMCTSKGERQRREEMMEVGEAYINE